LLVGAALAATTEVVSCLQLACAAPIDPHSAIEKQTTAPDRANPDIRTGYTVRAIEAAARHELESFVHYVPEIITLTGLFAAREFEPSISDDNHKMYSGPDRCAYPDSYLRTLDGTKDECWVAKPGMVEREFLTLPFFALSAWGLIILTIASLPRLYGRWRVRRWLRRVGAQGVGRSAASSRGVAAHTRRRSSSRRKARPRSYAG